ncbi:hypothetical protein [Archangium minus]|uniref:hypothetical protein n=1 Tax=Archangium minus TaxID=83450 RepID=UPI0037C073A5
MLAILLMVLLSQQPPTHDETSAECLCETSMTSQEQALLNLFGAVARRAEVAEEAGQTTGTEAKAQESAADCSEPKECKGQLHHVISWPIAKALGIHRTLRGLYKPRDPRFVSRAVDAKAHCGYQQ